MTRPKNCGLCGAPIDYRSGFWFDTEERGVGIEHTCGDANCVNPEHLKLVKKGANV